MQLGSRRCSCKEQPFILGIPFEVMLAGLLGDSRVWAVGLRWTGGEEAESMESILNSQ